MIELYDTLYPKGYNLTSGGHSSNEFTAEKISEALIDFYETPEGKINKENAHKKRSITMEIERDKIRSTITTKKCCTCGIEKDITMFHVKSAQRDGLQSNCKECNNLIKREWRRKNKEVRPPGKVFKCSKCPKAYSLKDSLKRHMNTEHSSK